MDLNHKSPSQGPVRPRPRRKSPLGCVPAGQLDAQKPAPVTHEPLDAIQGWDEAATDSAARVVRVDLVVRALFERGDDGADVGGRGVQGCEAGGVTVVTVVVIGAVQLRAEVWIEQAGAYEDGLGAQGEESSHLAQVEGVTGAGVSVAAATLVLAGLVSAQEGDGVVGFGVVGSLEGAVRTEEVCLQVGDGVHDALASVVCFFWGWCQYVKPVWGYREV